MTVDQPRQHVVIAQVDDLGRGEACGDGGHVTIPDLNDAPVADHDGARPARWPPRPVEQLAGVDDYHLRFRRLGEDGCCGGKSGDDEGGNDSKHAWGSPGAKSMPLGR